MNGSLDILIPSGRRASRAIRRRARLRSGLRGLVAIGCAAAGAFQLGPAERSVIALQPFLPRAFAVVAGVVLILGGVGLLLPPIRRIAALALVFLCLAQLPGLVRSALDPPEGVVPADGWTRAVAVLLLALLVYWCARRSPLDDVLDRDAELDAEEALAAAVAADRAASERGARPPFRNPRRKR